MEHLCDISVVKDLLNRHGFHFAKSLGQNFLINPSVCPKIAEDGIVSAKMGALEIGTGIGVLTNELAKRASKVVAVEIDDRLFPILEETLSEHQHINIIHGDAMKIDFQELFQKEFAGMEVCVCANLPYYITSPIIMKLLEQRLPVTSITVMVQKEAAVRLCAQPGTRECGAVSFAVRYYSEPKQLFSVSRGSFLPAPNVDSAVVRFTVREPSRQAKNETLLFRLVKAGFSQRRKTLANPVSAALSLSKKDLIEIMSGLSIKPTVRAEEMAFEDWIRLADALDNRH